MTEELEQKYAVTPRSPQHIDLERLEHGIEHIAHAIGGDSSTAQELDNVVGALWGIAHALEHLAEAFSGPWPHIIAGREHRE